MAIVLMPWLMELISLIVLYVRSLKSEKFLCKNLRYLVYITGQVRAGKTTFQAGYANIRTKDLRKRARRKIDFICLAFPDIPFDLIENDIKADFLNGAINSDQEARNLVASNRLLNKYADESYDNYITPHPVPFVTILSQFIDAKWALWRNNYVYYYGKAFYSQITKNDAMDYDPRMINIKNLNISMSEKNPDRDPKNDYHIFPYSIIAEDEKMISGKDCMKFSSFAKADTGSADWMRLIGHLGQETIYYCTTNQYWGADINRERDLATDIVSMKRCVAINPFFMNMWLIRLIERPFYFFLKLNAKKTNKGNRVRPLERNSWQRNLLSYLMYRKKEMASHGYVVYNGLIYHNPADFGKKVKSTTFGIDKLHCTIRLKYCFGSINTFQFHSVQQALIAKSHWVMKDEPKTIQDGEIANRVLQKTGGKVRQMATPPPA